MGYISDVLIYGWYEGRRRCHARPYWMRIFQYPSWNNTISAETARWFIHLTVVLPMCQVIHKKSFFFLLAVMISIFLQKLLTAWSICFLTWNIMDKICLLLDLNKLFVSTFICLKRVFLYYLNIKNYLLPLFITFFLRN